MALIVKYILSFKYKLMCLLNIYYILSSVLHSQNFKNEENMAPVFKELRI